MVWLVGDFEPWKLLAELLREVLRRYSGSIQVIDMRRKLVERSLYVDESGFDRLINVHHGHLAVFRQVHLVSLLSLEGLDYHVYVSCTLPVE